MSLSPTVVQTLVLFVLMASRLRRGQGPHTRRRGQQGHLAPPRQLHPACPDNRIDAASLHARPSRPRLRMLGVSFLAYALAFPFAGLRQSHRRRRARRGAPMPSARYSPTAPSWAFPSSRPYSARTRSSPRRSPISRSSSSPSRWVPTCSRKRREGRSSSALSSFVTPAAVASVLGFGFFVGNIALPEALGGALGILGDTTTPAVDGPHRLDHRQDGLSKGDRKGEALRDLAVSPRAFPSRALRRLAGDGPQGTSLVASRDPRGDAGRGQLGDPRRGLRGRLRDGEFPRPRFHDPFPAHHYRVLAAIRFPS